MNFKYLLINVLVWGLLIGQLSAQQKEDILANTLVTEHFSGQHLLQIFHQLEARYPIQFFYKEEWIPRRPLDISFDQQPLGEVLNRLVAAANLGFVQYATHSFIIAPQIELFDLDAFSYTEYVEEVDALDDREKKARTDRLFIVGDSTLRPLPAQANISGILRDLDTEEPLAGGQISFPELGTGTFSASGGKFEIRIPTGKHEAIIKAPGREEIITQIVAFSDGSLEISLGYTAFQLDEVLLQAGSEGQSAESRQAGRVQLSMINIKRSPALMGEVDIINAILLLPGVSTAGEASSGFNVRGGNIDQNLIIQDAHMLFNSSHLLGFFSVINPDIVKSATLYKGHIPAQYGGRVSSVLDIDLMEGSTRTYKGQGSIGLFASKFMMSGPIQREKSSFVVGIRGAYPNLITNNIDRVADVALSSSYYGDITLKLTQRVGEMGKFSIYGNASTDFFRFNREFGFGWNNYSAGLSWQQIYSDQLSFKAEVNGSRYTSNFFNLNDILGSSNDTGIDNINYRLNVQYVPVRSHDIHAGISGTYVNILPNAQNPHGENSALIPRIAQKDQGLEVGLYINDDFDLNSFVSFSVGLRFSYFQNMGAFQVYDYAAGLELKPTNVTDSTYYEPGQSITSYNGLEPRISMRVLFDETSSIKLSYNRVNQYIHLLSNTASATPIDIWQVSNPYFPAQKADNFSVGFFKNFQNKIWQTSVEFFYREMKGLVVPKDFANLLGNPNIETEVLNAVGQAYGAELSIKRNFGKLDVEGSFTYSRSFRRTQGNLEGITVNNGDWFPSDFDSPINVSLSLKYRPSLTKTISASFIYRTGRPITVPSTAYAVYPSWFVPNFSERNSFRIPDYHRLDLAYTFDDGLISRRKVTTEFTFSLYNVYARKNAYSVFFRKKTDEFTLKSSFQAYQLAILGTVLPFFSYNFKF